MTLNSWPEGTEDYVGHTVIKEYIQDTARRTGIEAVIQYSTRVDGVEKLEGKWRVKTTTLGDGKSTPHEVHRDWVWSSKASGIRGI